jgi:hypothetical protein
MRWRNSSSRSFEDLKNKKRKNMKKLILMIQVLALASFAMASDKKIPVADFTRKVGPVRPELHSSGFGPMICSCTEQALDDIRAMGFKSARTHDWALINPNQRVCDWHHMFPLEHLDATKPENYVFGPTDYLLKRTREDVGLDIFFRLGTSIEHSGPKVHFNSLIPKDFDKVAEVFAGTVRHYNRGWANGYKWNIRYWEIWNEPDGFNNMFCLPDGDGGATQAETDAKSQKRLELFAELFVKCLKRLKSEFGDSIKVGGPATISLREDYFRFLFKKCKEAGVEPDFISWHGYTNNPKEFSDAAERARKMCDEFGFTKCELIVNEWHYFGENYTWGDMQHCADPKIKARIWDGPDSHNGIRSSCFTLATLVNLQDSKLDQAFYYGCRHIGSWGFKDAMHKKYKVFYALKLFGDIMRNYAVRCAGSTEGTITTFPVESANGRKGLLVVDYGGTKRRIDVQLKGVDVKSKLKAKILDYKHDLTPLEPHPQFGNQVTISKDGVLTIWKPDFFSAAFFITFD